MGKKYREKRDSISFRWPKNSVLIFPPFVITRHWNQQACAESARWNSLMDVEPGS
jgi:hypothetical protein